MTFKCSTETQLNRIATGAGDPHLAGAAVAALRMMSDINRSAFTAVDIACLHGLVDAIHQDGHLAILDNLYEDAPDCRVCAALASRILELRATG